LPLYALFFFSGFPALLYQIVWQRALFTIYGVNIESVTVVVTAFMLGLGFGSLLGGLVSKISRVPLLTLFGLIELGIGTYGLFSLPIFHAIGEHTTGGSAAYTGIVAFALVLIPTILMGSTLPLLVAYNVRVNRNVGASVSVLYAVNTFGSAAACFAAALYVMKTFGESGTVRFAAGFNLIIGAAVLLFRFLQASAAPSMDAEETVTSRQLISFPRALIAAGLAGFIALGYEIVWYRIFAFASYTLATTFASLLGFYLLGIAVGSLVTERIFKTQRSPEQLVRLIAYCVLAATVLAFLVAPGLAAIVQHWQYSLGYALVALAAAVLGAVFPMLCHASIAPDRNAGRRTGMLYIANIIGSALGSYGIGFILMDVFRIQQICVILALSGICLALLLVLSSPSKETSIIVPAVVALAVTAFVTSAAAPLFSELYEKLQLKRSFQPGMRFHDVVETRSGVVTVTDAGIVFGGGVYDGMFNVDIHNDRNGIFRAFATSFLKPGAKDVLIVGLASGSWAQVIANDPDVRSVTIVEINPGYVQLIARRPEVASLLKNPKVMLVIDDGRRWLVRNPDRKFDLTVMNTTFHWRAHASNLLSVEFLQLVRKHLNPGGVHFYNPTESARVFATGLAVFPYGVRVGNSLALSDAPFALDADRYRRTLANWMIDGTRVFDLTNAAHAKKLDEVVAILAPPTFNTDSMYSLGTADFMRPRLRDQFAITDDNMGTEWTVSNLP
jgi:spermidine synthase